jgi:hypothetical protein
VVITNGTGLLDQTLFDFFRDCALDPEGNLRASRSAEDPARRFPSSHSAENPQRALQIWLKLDAATEDWYRAVDRSEIPLAGLVSRFRDFAASGAPFILQTMVCRIEGKLPPQEESARWIQLVTELAEPPFRAGAASPAGAAALRAVQIYGKARPAPEDPLAEAAPAEFLEERAVLLRSALAEKGRSLPVEVFP